MGPKKVQYKQKEDTNVCSSSSSNLQQIREKDQQNRRKNNDKQDERYQAHNQQKRYQQPNHNRRHHQKDAKDTKDSNNNFRRDSNYNKSDKQQNDRPETNQYNNEQRHMPIHHEKSQQNLHQNQRSYREQAMNDRTRVNSTIQHSKSGLTLANQTSNSRWNTNVKQQAPQGNFQKTKQTKWILKKDQSQMEGQNSRGMQNIAYQNNVKDNSITANYQDDQRSAHTQASFPQAQHFKKNQHTRFNHQRDNKRRYDDRKPKNNHVGLPNLYSLLNQDQYIHQSDSEEEDWLLQFEANTNRPNEHRDLKSKSVGCDLQLDEERILKLAIKKYWQSCKININVISNIKVIVNYHYPIIYVQYCLNDNDTHVNSLVDLMRVARWEQKQLLDVFRKLYNTNFDQLKIDMLKWLMKVAQERAGSIGKQYRGRYESRNCRISQNMVAVSADISNGTVQFCFIDMNLNEITFNNIFVEKMKDKFPNAYQMINKKIKALQKQQTQQADNVVVADEEASSDDDRPVQSTPNIDNQRKELQKMLKENLDSFQDKIDEMDDRFQEIQDNPNKKQEADKLSEEIFELQITLDQYRECVTKFEVQFDNIGHSQQDQHTKDRKVHLIYKQLRILRNQLSSQLPIIARKRELFKKLDQNNLVILEGETGSGKSTQLPQMLCEYYKVFTDPKAKPIVLTQPRKLATRTLAERIAFEMDQKLHGFVDYIASSGRQSINSNCKIIVKLDRLLLDQIEQDPYLQKYSCLVIDQAHERTISIDVIVGLIKNILTKRSNFKVIITSATLDSALFEKYFSASTFKVSGRMYPVKIQYRPYKAKQKFSDKIYECITRDIMLQGNIRNEYRGHILAFCTTVDEINDLCQRFKSKLDASHFMICPLHGRLNPEQQRRAFEQSGNKIKLVFCSRIAETAITIDKVKVVIDVGFDREVVYDQKKRISSFELMPISKSAAKQRAGRAGRTSAGYCFRLYQQSDEKNMRVNKRPEIEGTPLDIVVLRLKQLQIKDLMAFPYLSRPPDENLKQSLETMQLIGCLDEKAEINEIGRTLVKIPIEPLLSRAIIDGIICDMLVKGKNITSKIIKVLAMIVNCSNVFYSSEDTKEICERSKFRDYAQQSGDFFSLLNVYEHFEKQYHSNKRSIMRFCKDRFLNKKTLCQAVQLVKEITLIVKNVTLNIQRFPQQATWMKLKIEYFRKDEDLITSCLLSSFCQNLCLYSGDSSIGYTHIGTETPIQLYGTSFLSLQGISPKWIICHDIFKTSRTFCRIAQDIDFKMLKLSVQPRVFEKYRLAECEKLNPFYENIKFQLPTAILKQFQHLKHNNIKMDGGLLENCECIINQDINCVKIYYIKNQQNNHIKQDVEDYIRQQKQQYLQDYSFSFLGLSTATMSSGCNVSNLSLHSDLFRVELQNLSPQTSLNVRNMYSPYCHSIIVKSDVTTFIFTDAGDRKVFIDWFNHLDRSITKHVKINLIDDSREKARQVAKGLLKIRFWAAERNERDRRYLMIYSNPLGWGNRAQNLPHKKVQQLNQQFDKDIKYTLDELNQYFKPENMEFLLTKKGNSINIYINNGSQAISDEHELQIRLREAYNNKPSLLKHLKLVANRSVDTRLSNITLDQWKRKLMVHIPWANEDLITMRGFNNDRNQKDQEGFLTDLHAQVSVFDAREAQRFVRKNEGRRNFLGSEKLHASIVYKQNITRIKKRIFKVFQAKYELLKSYILAEYQSLELSENYSIAKDGTEFVYLDVTGQQRDQLLKPVEKLRTFVTKLVEKVEPAVMQVLNSSSQGVKHSDRIFNKIQCAFDWKIYLETNRYRNEIEVYYSDDEGDNVLDMLRRQLSRLKQTQIKVSYRGKNIHIVTKVLDDHKNRVNSSVSFAERCVYLNGSLEDIEQCRNEINRIVNQQKSECDLCYNVLSVPVRIINCNHEFCTNCINDHIRSINDDMDNFPLKCPSYEKCGKYLNVYDIKMLLDEYQFNKTLENGVINLIDGVKYHGCLTPYCRQLFEVERTKNDQNEFSCGVCMIDYCNLCRNNAHQPKTCDEVRAENVYKDEKQDRSRSSTSANKYDKNNRRNKHQSNKKSGKQCQNCNKLLQRQGESLKVFCSCKMIICWLCSRTFKSDDAITMHLRAKHKIN